MIIENMSNTEYHARPEVSKSLLDKVNQSPAHYKAYKDGIITNETTPAMIKGSALHILCLEPHKAATEIAVKPDVDGRTKDGKTVIADFVANCEGKLILSHKDYQAVDGMATSLANSPFASLFKCGKAEASLFAEIDGVNVRAKPDFIGDNGFIYDLKSTDNASDEAFDRSIFNYRYYVQAAFYWDIYALCYGREPQGFTLVPVESSLPHNAGKLVTFYPDNKLLEYGRQEYRRNLATLKECRETGNFYGYFKNIEDAQREAVMPAWLERRLAA